MTQTNTLFVLLDWEKAFDKIRQAALLQALSRFQLPQHILDIIAMLYSSPTFFVEMDGSRSDTYVQQT
eukprot:3128039-Prorocentrum_lima.AAC.1